MDHIKKQKGLYRCRLGMTENYKRLNLRYTNGALRRSLAVIRRIVSGVLPVVSVFGGVVIQILRTRVPVWFHVEYRSYFRLIFFSCRICLVHTERSTVLITFRKCVQFYVIEQYYVSLSRKTIFVVSNLHTNCIMFRPVFQQDINVV
jgi:hypothetical protein